MHLSKTIYLGALFPNLGKNGRCCYSFWSSAGLVFFQVFAVLFGATDVGMVSV